MEGKTGPACTPLPYPWSCLLVKMDHGLGFQGETPVFFFLGVFHLYDSSFEQRSSLNIFTSTFYGVAFKR
jgi:hypothetical protein